MARKLFRVIAHIFSGSEHGFATHYIPARRIPTLLERLAALEHPHPTVIDRAIEELSLEHQSDERLTSTLTGKIRSALDYAFRHDTVEKILEDLKSFLNHGDESVRDWAKNTLAMLELRSPTSLKVALKAIRKGRDLTLLEALNMELKIATAYCVSLVGNHFLDGGLTGDVQNDVVPDFITGVRAVLLEKIEGRPQWSPSNVEEVTDEIVSRFFDSNSPYLASAPQITVPEHLKSGPSFHLMKHALPMEEDIGVVVRGAQSTGGTTGITLDELVARFEQVHQGKLGVREKVVEVAQRRCDTVKNAGSGLVWLKWNRLRARP